jgi:hypothetical protein
VQVVHHGSRETTGFDAVVLPELLESKWLLCLKPEQHAPVKVRAPVLVDGRRSVQDRRCRLRIANRHQLDPGGYTGAESPSGSTTAPQLGDQEA